MSWIMRRRLRAGSRVVAAAQDETMRALQEGFGSLREILLAGTQAWHGRRYAEADWQLRRALGVSQFTGSAPRYLMEAFGLALIALLAWRLSLGSGGLPAALTDMRFRTGKVRRDEEIKAMLALAGHGGDVGLRAAR